MANETTKKVFKVEAVKNEADASFAYTVYVTASEFPTQTFAGMKLDPLFESASQFVADMGGIESRKSKIGHWSQRTELGNW